MVSPVRFLLVDDLEENLLAMHALLQRDGLELLKARSGREAMELLLTHEVALVLLDVQMPEMDGFDLAERMRETERTRRVPIVFVTANAADQHRPFRGSELGVVDFLFAPFNPHVLRSKADVFFELARPRSALRDADAENARLPSGRAEVDRGMRERETALLHRVIDNLFAFVGVLGLDGTLLDANQAPLDMANITRDDVVGRKFWDCIWWSHSGEAQARVRDACERAARGERVRFDIQTRAAGGALLWIDFQVAPLRDPDGCITHVIPSAVDITARKQSESALARESARLEALLEACPAGIIMADAEGKLIRMNPAKASQWEPAPLTATVDAYRERRGWWADASPRQGSPLEPDEWALARALRGEATSGDLVEIEPFGAPGTRRIMINSGAPVRDRDGHIIGGVAAQMDVTELKQTERALRESEERVRRQFAELEAIYRTAPLGLCVLDTELRFCRINERMAEMNGVPVEDHLGRTVREILPGLSVQAERALREVLRTGEVLQFELRGETPAQPGRERIWDECWYPLREGDGRISGIGVVAVEITERKQTEKALRDSEALFHTLADNLPQLAWMTHADGHAFWYNRRMFDYTGATLEKLQGWAGWQSVPDPDHAGRVAATFRASLASGQPWEDTFPVRGKDGHPRWFLSRAFPIRDESGSIVRWFGTNTDITALREAQDALFEAEKTIRLHAADLERTVAERTAELRETVQELDAFSYSIAHDMRAPLRSMAGYADILLEEHAAGLDAEARDFLGRIGRSASRLDLLILDILDYSRIVRTELPLGPVDTHQLIVELLDNYPNLREVSDCITVDPAIPPVHANDAALTQVFSNLLGNAVKFVAPGTMPSVRVWGERLAGPPDEPGRVRLWVEDNGIGIDPAVQPRLFHMFQRFVRPGLYDGTGMGLAIARKATDRMGGRIGVESAPAQGSRFWVVLPAAGPTATT